VGEDGWRAAIDRLVESRLTLLGLWGEPTAVHMALLDERSGEVAVLSLDCKSGTFPSVGAQHPPARRLERTIRDLFGLQAAGSADPRPWLDHGAWDQTRPLGAAGASAAAAATP